MQVKTIVFPNRIQALRKDQKLGLRELAEATGISISYLSMIERGLRLPSDETQEVLARELGQASAQDLKIRHDTETELHLWRTLMDQIRPTEVSAALFGRKLKAFRQQRGVSVRELCEQEEAKQAHLQPWLVRELELGSRLPQEDDLKALAMAFRLSGPDELNLKLDEAAELEARQRAAAKLKSETKKADAGKLVLRPGNVVLNSTDGRGLTDTQRIVDGALIPNADSFFLQGAQFLVDRAKQPEEGDLVLVMAALRTVGLGRLQGQAVIDPSGQALEGTRWQVKSIVYS